MESCWGSDSRIEEHWLLRRAAIAVGGGWCEADLAEDAFDRGGFGDGTEHAHAVATVVAFEFVYAESAFFQLCPRHARACQQGRGCWRGTSRSDFGLGTAMRWHSHDLLTAVGVARKQTVVSDLTLTGSWDQKREPTMRSSRASRAFFSMVGVATKASEPDSLAWP